VLYQANYDRANLLRRSLLAEIPCYAISSVNFLTKKDYYPSASSSPEEISSRLGQVPLVQEELPADPERHVYLLDVTADQGVRKVTTSDIDDLPATNQFEIARLTPGEHLTCEIRLARGTPRDHMKYMVTSLVGMTAETTTDASSELNHWLTFELTGQYPIGEVLRLAIAGLDTVLTDVPENMYYRLAPTAQP